MIEETMRAVVREVGVLEKFEGEPVPENLIEKIFIENGEIIKRETYRNGRLLKTEQVKEVG